MALPTGETAGRSAGNRIHLPVATTALLAAIPAEERIDGMVCAVTDGTQGSASNWVFSAASAAVDATSQLVVTPTVGTGAWLRTDKLVDLKIAVDFNKADAAVLFTVPTGFKLRIPRAFWEVTLGFTGGAASTIGLSSSNTGVATKGDLLGAAAGDAAAVLIVASPGPYVGAAGAKTAGAAPVVLVAADTIIFNRITSAFTAGTGFAHVLAELVS